MTRLGHSTPRSALIYQHASEERDQAITSGLDTLIKAERTNAHMARRQKSNPGLAAMKTGCRNGVDA